MEICIEEFKYSCLNLISQVSIIIKKNQQELLTDLRAQFNQLRENTQDELPINIQENLQELRQDAECKVEKIQPTLKIGMVTQLELPINIQENLQKLRQDTEYKVGKIQFTKETLGRAHGRKEQKKRQGEKQKTELQFKRGTEVSAKGEGINEEKKKGQELQGGRIQGRKKENSKWSNSREFETRRGIG